MPLTRTALLASLVLLAGCTTLTPSRNGRTYIQSLGEGSFAVHAFGNPGSTAEAMGRRAMLEACTVTRERGYAYYGVNDFSSASSAGEAQTRTEGTDYVLNSTGQAVGAIYRPAEYEQYRYGKAILVVTTLSPGSIDLLGGSMQVVDAGTCLVHSRPR